MLIHQRVGAVVQHAELAVSGGTDAEGVQQAGHAALAVRALLQRQRDLVVGVAVAVQVFGLDGTPQLHPAVPRGGNVHLQRVQPVLANHHGLGAGHVHDGGDGVDVAVRLTPSRHAILADRRHDVRHQIQIIVQRHDGALAHQIHHAIRTGLHDVRQLPGRKNGGDLRGVVILHAPVDVELRARHRLDRHEIIAAVKLGGIVVVVDTHAGDFQPVVEVKVLALGQSLCGFDQRGAHLLDGRRGALGQRG